MTNGRAELKPARVQAVAPPADPPRVDLFAYDRRAQRRAMLSMAAAMGTMLVGLPLHLAALGGPARHAALGPLGWLAAALATVAVVAGLPALRSGPGVPATLGRGEQALVLCCAAAAYLCGWAAVLGGTHRAMYFDVAAMSVAWLAEGRALDLDARRRAVAATAQLAPLSGARCPEPPASEQRSVAVPLALVLLIVAAAAGGHALTGADPGQALLAGLAVFAACAPCALGRARASALAGGGELARRDGWIVASSSALAIAQPWRAAVALPHATRSRLEHIGRAARRAGHANTLWAVLAPALLAPLALRGPLDPLLPAAAMLVAWAAIGLTNRVLAGYGDGG